MNIREYILEIINIKNESDREYTISTIREGIYIKGANFWYLVCSAIIASIGLDTNSPAVIIGAMLVSPLMSPILGIGLGTGIYDRDLLQNSVRQFLFAVTISIAISIIYFFLTPLGNATHELLARTKPTLLDVGVALFGGIAGIVAGTRKGIVNSIPGVAIATALMPPLCTAGFGIASGNTEFFLGAIYLFFINAVFISLSAFLVVRYLKFPYKEYIDPRKKTRMRHFVFWMVFIITIPSLVIFYNITKEANRQKLIKSFISKYIERDDVTVLNWKFYEKESGNVLRIFYAGKKELDKLSDTLNMITRNSGETFSIELERIDSKENSRYLEEKPGSEIDNKILTVINENALLKKKIKDIESGSRIKATDSLKISKLNTIIGLTFPFIRNFSVKGDSLFIRGDSIKTNVIYVEISMNNNNKPEVRKKISDYIEYITGYDSSSIVFKK